jgi:hypothetical protein
MTRSDLLDVAVGLAIWCGVLVTAALLWAWSTP